MSDWLAPWLPNLNDRNALRLARLLTLASAAVHAGVAIAVCQMKLTETTVKLVLAIAGFSTGLLLGLYALGLLGRKISEAESLAAFVVGTAVTCVIMYTTNLSTWWYTLVGSTTIVIAGIILHVAVYLFRSSATQEQLTPSVRTYEFP